jgi:hypothetical protein
VGDLQLPEDELYVLCHWASQAVAEAMHISDDQAADLLAAASDSHRVAILGNNHFAGVTVDDRWVVAVGRARITEATHEWQALRAMETQFPD